MEMNPAQELVVGNCRLCHKERPLRISHFMPAALYPKNKKKKAMATLNQTFLDPEHITARAFCDECEQRFNRNGETEVLRWIAPKAKKGRSPLQITLRERTPVWRDPDCACHWSSSLGISPEKFAYFALSLLWKAAACEWPMPNGEKTTRLDLGERSEPIRLFLLDEQPFPEHTYIMLTVCTDEKPQEYWMPPTRSAELEGITVAPIMGALFRFWLGRVLPVPIHKTVFYPADGNPIFTTHCWDILSQGFGQLFAT